MDLSKLPRLSETKAQADANRPSPPSPAENQPIPTADYAPAEPTRDPTGAWISIGVGVILLLMHPRLLQFIAHKLFGTNFVPFTKPTGEEVPYTTLIDFYSDLGITSFAIILILEGIALLLAFRRSVLWVAFVLTVAVTLYNLGYLLYTYGTYGLPMMSALAVIFGGFVASQHWRALHARSRA